MATTTPNFGWVVPTSTDLVKDGATAIETLGDSIDASLLDLKGGTTGQVLAKNSATDMDFVWAAIDPLVILDAKGDLITATAADTPARLAVGTDGQTLVADSTASTGLKWATPSAASFVGASAYRTVSQNLSNATETALTFDAENYDTDAFHNNSTNNTRMTVPAGKAGKYLITAQTVFTNNATGQRIVYTYVNSTNVTFTGPAIGGSASIDLGLTTSYVANLSVGDIVEVRAYQNSGGTLAVFGDTARSSFQVSYLGA